MPPPLPMRANILRRLTSRSTPRTEYHLIHQQPTPLQNHATTPSAPLQRPYRQFSQTPLLQRKNLTRDPDEAAHDPYDFSTLESSIEKVVEKLKSDLGKLRTGGRFNPEVLESLRVHLEKDSKASEKLGDLAQVLPKGGRSLMILVGEKEHVKPIISAIQGAKDLNLQPVQDAHNATQLNVPIPPPTKESRDLALKGATKAGDNAHLGIRAARGVMQKRYRAMVIQKTIRPDDLKMVSKEMEKIVEKSVGDVKKTVEAARKGMEQA